MAKVMFRALADGLYPVSRTKRVFMRCGETRELDVKRLDALLADGLIERVADDTAVVEDAETATSDLETIKGIGADLAQELSRRGWLTKEDLAAVSDRDLLAVPGIGLKKLAEIRSAIAED